VDLDAGVGCLLCGGGMKQCDARRSDGVLCEDEFGHYGGHAWPDCTPPMLLIGDTMRISVELLKDIHDQPEHSSVRVIVREIR
jgi:hypothetical protein